MSRRTRHEPDEDDDPDGSDEYDAYHDYDPDEPETYPSGLYDDDGPPLVPCPYCREEIVEDIERCPHCGNYLSKEDSPPGEPKSRFWVVMMLLALLAAAFWTLGG
jgi:hypothetical protein